MECPVCGDRLRGLETISRETEKHSGEIGRTEKDHGKQRSQPKKTTKAGLLGNLMDVIGGAGGD